MPTLKENELWLILCEDSIAASVHSIRTRPVEQSFRDMP